MTTDERDPWSGLYPYAERFGVLDRLPEHGRPRAAILAELETMAAEEDARWQTGQCSGTMYCGDLDHYAFLNRAFALFSHMNALQRDLCPSATRFEGEIGAMTLDLLHADAVQQHHPGARPRASITSGGTESILTAVLVHRDRARAERGVTAPEMILPRTAHPAFEKAAHLFGLRVVRAPVDPATTEVDMDFVRAHVSADTVLLVGSAGNYPYGTVDPIDQLSALARERDIGLHVDACLGGFILPWGEALGYPVPVFDFRLPGVTTISVDTHKFGYGLKGGSVLLYRDKALREYAYFTAPDWPGGKYNSPGIAGSRSVGLLAATWASLVHLGRDGLRRHAQAIFETAFAMQEIVRAHPPLRLLGRPTFCFAFTSDVLDIYHVNDALRARGWRLNGLQYPNALHLCVTLPQTRPGIVERFADDLAAAVAYAAAPPADPPRSAAIYGGLPGDIPGADAVVRRLLVDYLDRCSDLPGR